MLDRMKWWLSLLLVGLAACGGGGGSTGPAEFRLVESTPAAGAQAVGLNVEIRLRFSVPVDPATVDADSVEVGVVGMGKVQGETSIDGEDDRVLLWNASLGLFPVETHACRLDEDLRAMGGQRLSGTTQFIFRTAGGTPSVPLPPPESLTTARGRLNVGRRSHRATLLGDGRVLVTGGFQQSTNITDRAELFSPLTELFTPTEGSLQQERAGHTATRLEDGRVLLAGGYYEASVGQLVTTDSAEVYDPATGLFTSVGSMTTQRVDHAALRLPDGRVLLTGGSRVVGGFFEDLDTAEVFDPTSGTFTALAALMPHTHSTHVMEDMGNGKVLIAGGSDTDLSATVFDVATETFTSRAPAADDMVRFGAMGAAFESGAVCVAGGSEDGSVLYVEPRSQFLQNTGSGLGRARAYGTATRIAGDRILVVGGFDRERGFFLLHTADLVLEGGVGGSATYETELYFPEALALHTATRLADGRVLFCGGINETSGQPELDVAYLLSP